MNAFQNQEHLLALADPAINAIAKASSRHLREAFHLTCLIDLMILKIFPNAKELTESMASVDAARRHLGVKFTDPSVLVVSVGDGRTPRTAALCAFRTKWSCYSLDPMLSMSDHYDVERLTVLAAKLEDKGTIEHIERAGSQFRNLVFLAVHSHCDLAAVEGIRHPKKSLVSIPCCVPHKVSKKPDVIYRDLGVLSPQRTVMVWKSIPSPDEVV